ncbi:MAG: PKD domain-containing protein [Candidatus Thermoplasmatota archaeon]
MRRTITSVILVIILTISIPPVMFDRVDAAGRGIYVSVSYPYNTGDGSADKPYRSIQYAIDKANDGDTIYIFDGLYNETLVINKRVSIVGIDRKNVTIQKIGGQPRYLIEVKSDYVTIEDVTLFNSPDGSVRVALIYVTSDFITLQGVNVTNSTTWGVYLDKSSGHTIGNSLFYNTKGVYAYYSDNNVFSGNYFEKNTEAGVKLVRSNNNIFYNNTFNNTQYGVYSEYSNGVNITFNKFSNCSIDGIKIYGGSNNIISRSYIYNNSGNGVYISSTKSIIKDNRIHGNQIGLNIYGSSSYIYSNTFNNSKLIGLICNSGTSNNIIYLNRFNRNAVNAKENGRNQWYSNNAGNYWDDYKEVDRNLDGIGDKPYSIPGGGLDLYPLGLFLKPPGKPSDPRPKDGADNVGLLVTLSVKVTDPDSDSLSVYFYSAVDDKLYGEIHGVKSGSRGNCTFRLPFETTFPWYAVVNDSKLENKSDIFIFTTRQIPPTNKKPVSNPGGPYIAAVNQNVVFDASGSYDPDGNISFYRWNFGDGSSEILSSSPTHAYSSIGVYTVTLTVVDNQGRSSTNTTTVAVGTTLPNKPPIPVITAPTIGNTKTSLLFSATDSYDPDGSIINYTWSFGDGEYGYGSSVVHTYEKQDVYMVTLTVVDNEGEAASTSSTITIENKKDEGIRIPGFEFLIYLSACLVILLMMYSRKSKEKRGR